MQITLAINTEDISPKDAELLRVIAGLAGPRTEVKEATSEATEGPAGAPAPEEDEKASEGHSLASEDTEGPDEALLDEAIARATHLIRKEKRGAEVKEALSRVGVEKVTHLTDDKTIQSFLDALPQD